MENIGYKIKVLRKNKRLSQENFGEMLGLTGGAVSKWERGENNPLLSDLPKIAEILGVNIEEITGGNATNPILYNSQNIHHIPYLAVKAYASFIDQVEQRGYEFEERIPVTYNPGESPRPNQIVIEVAGTSMEPTIIEGAKILIEEVPDNDIKYINSGIYAIVYDSQFVVKRIIENELHTHGILTLYSDNPKAGFVKIPQTSIRKVWKALEIVKQKLS